MRTFPPKDILGFLGPKGERRVEGEVHTPSEDDRGFGTRIKHRRKTHWRKRDDKFGLILRGETVINSPQEFSVSRTGPPHAGTSSGGSFPLTQGVSSLVPSQQQAGAGNRRSWDAWAVGDAPAPASRPRRHLPEPKGIEGRSDAGFNLARGADVPLFLAVREGDQIARGVRNRDIREPRFGHPKRSGSQPRARAAVGRLFKRRHVRQLVAKIPRTRRGRVTERGRHLLGLAVQLSRSTWPQLAA